MRKPTPLRAIQAFEAFGRRGSVTAAANELGVSVGAVSQQIRKAEEALQTRLLERRGRSVALTALGRVYYEAVSIAFKQLRDAENVVARARSAATLTISCLPSLASKWIAPQLMDWQTGHAGATVRLIGAEQEPSLGPDQVDFRISYGSKIHDFDNYSELFTDCVVPACAPALLAEHPVGVPSDILKFPLLGIEWARDHQSPPSWAEWAKSIGASYRRASGEVAFSLSSAAIDAAINGKGFVLAQLSMAADDIASGRLVVPFDQRVKLPDAYFLAWDRGALEKPFGPDLRAWIISISKRLGSVSVGSGTAPRQHS